MLRSTLVALSLLTAPTVRAAEVPPAMSQYIYDDLMSWINHRRIVSAVTEQNARNHGLNEAEILAQDAAWRAEFASTDRPLVDTLLNGSLSAFLRKHQEQSRGRITEVIVMDNKGLNVASSGVTSDYWQGDEAKFRETYFRGSGAVFVDKVTLDESTQTYQGQVSFALTDPATGIVIGAITVGLNASAFY